MKNRKFWITASLICVSLGIILTAAGRLMGGHPGFYIDKTGVHASGSQNEPDPVQDSMTLEEFDSMEIHADYADVELILSDEFAVEYCIRGGAGNPVCEVRNGRLTFQERDRFQAYSVGFFTMSMDVPFHEPWYFVKIMIPKDTKLSEAIFDIESGDLDISSIQADTLRIADDYGDVTMDRCESKALDIQMESGTLILGTVDAPQTSLDNEYGRIDISKAAGGSLTIQMESCDLKAGSLDYSDTDIASDYGRVNISDISGDRLIVRMESGDCQIDRMDCRDARFTNSYGNIRLGLPGETDSCGFNLKAEYGGIRVGDYRTGYSSNESNAVYTAAGDGTRMIVAACESGDIEIESVK